MNKDNFDEVFSNVLSNLSYRDFERRTFSLRKFLKNEHLQ